MKRHRLYADELAVHASLRRLELEGGMSPSCEPLYDS